MVNGKWYEMDIPFDEVKKILSANLKQMSISFIAAGYYMKYIRDKKLYLQDGYNSIWEFAEIQYGIQKSTASRWMAMNDRFSKDGNSPVLADEYKSFNKSQLQEMLYLDSEQIKAAEPEMSAKEIRAIRKLKKETVAPAQPEKDIEPAQKACVHQAGYTCTLNAAQQVAEGDGENCNEKCCWNCPKHGHCGYECNSSAHRPEQKTEKEIKMAKCITGESGSGYCGAAAYCGEKYKCCSQCDDICNSHCGWITEESRLKKPDETEKEYLKQAARYLILCWHDWFLQNFQIRVLNTETSPAEIKQKLGKRSRDYWFSTEKGVAHINLFDEYVQLWDEKNTCLGNFDWFYMAAEIHSMWNIIAMENAEKECVTKKQQATEECCEKAAETEEIPAKKQREFESWPPELSDIPVPSLVAVKDLLEEQERSLKEYLACDGLPAMTVLKEQLITGGLRIIRNLVEDVLETAEEELDQEEAEHPELPVFKNNDQRKEWLRNYTSWGFWYEDKNIGARYYKYDFDNGARLIAEVYDSQIDGWWKTDHDQCYMHLVGGPNPKEKNGIQKWTYHSKYSKHPNSETELIEFLKEIQRED